MLRLRTSILTHLLSSSAASPVSSLPRLLSSAAPRISPNTSFAVEQYLVDSCGLTRAQALKASAKLSHLNSPSNSDAVLAFLAGLGLSSADVAALVAKDPLFLCTAVDRTLAPNLVGLTGLGLSRTEIARLASLTPSSFRCSNIVSNLPYYLLLYGSYENLLRIIKRCSNLLACDFKRVVQPNFAFLRECGLAACDITKLCIAHPRLITRNLDGLQAMVASTESLGVPRGSVMFRHVMPRVGHLRKEKIAGQVKHLKNMFRWSDAEVHTAVSKIPMMLTRSKDDLQCRSEFLISEVGLEPAYIAHHPALLSYSLEGRLRPRYYVVKFLKENGLLDPNRSYYSAVMVTEKVFMEKYISPHKETAPHLSEDYAAACRGEVPTSFRFA